MKVNVRDWSLCVTNIAIKHPPFLAKERSKSGHKVQSCFFYPWLKDLISEE